MVKVWRQRGDSTNRLFLWLSAWQLYGVAEAHMSLWDPAMFGFNGPNGCKPPNCFPGQEQVSPMGEGWPQEQWWFRGTNYTTGAALPAKTKFAELPAGGTWTTEITCHRDYTSWSLAVPSKETKPSDPGNACPGALGLYHAHNEDDSIIPYAPALGGCALGIADVTDPSKATMENIVIFSVQAKCVQQKMTPFAIPAAMPSCTGEICICAWFWTATQDKPNYYMTGFNCKITNTKSSVRWGTPQVPQLCSDSSKCVKGPKQAIYSFNQPTNTPIWDTKNPNANRPQYAAGWGYTDGAQDDIFQGGSTAPLNGTGSTSSAGTSEGGSTKVMQQTSSSRAVKGGSTGGGGGGVQTAPFASASASAVGGTATPSTSALRGSTGDDSSETYTPTGGESDGGPTLAPTVPDGTGGRGSEVSQTPVPFTGSPSPVPSTSTTLSFSNPLIIAGLVAFAVVVIAVAFFVGRRGRGKNESGDEEKEKRGLTRDEDSDEDSS